MGKVVCRNSIRARVRRRVDRAWSKEYAARLEMVTFMISRDVDGAYITTELQHHVSDRFFGNDLSTDRICGFRQPSVDHCLRSR